MASLGPVELIIILVVVLLVFGVGRLSKIGGEMGSAIREFRSGIEGEGEKEKESAEAESEEPESA